ncbi:hypothetical protein QQP08_006597 [Theobroma cacao]|nr:hypothetical protein QQP08_006597 [Theobroma cacao]
MIVQMKQHCENFAKRYKALSCIHYAAICSIFTRIMACESVKEVRNKLKEEFQDSDKTRQMQILNLMREFEMLTMKDNEAVKDYIDELTKIMNM